MSSTLLERVQTWIAANDAASAARDAEIAEHGFEVGDERWTNVLALMPPVREIAEGLVASAAEVERLTALVERQRLALLAEQGIAEGAPSDRWTWGIIDEEGGIGWKCRTARGMIFAWGRGVELGSRGQPSEPHPGGWAEWTTNEDGDLDDEIARATAALWNVLDAMEAAEAAHPSTPPAIPECGGPGCCFPACVRTGCEMEPADTGSTPAPAPK